MVEVAVAYPGADDAIKLGIHHGLGRQLGGVGIAIDDTDLGQLVELAHIERGLAGVQASRAALIVDLAVVDVAKRTEVGGGKGLHASGVGLGDVAGIQHGIVHGDHDATAFGGGIGGGDHGVVKVHRAVGAHGGGGAHGADQYHRLVALDGEVEEVGGLFHGVGAVGDDDAIHIILGQQLVDPLGQLQPHLVVHVLGANLDYLLPLHVGHVLHFGDGGDQGLDGYLASLIVGLGGRLAGAGDSAAGSQNMHIGQGHGHGGEGQAEHGGEQGLADR